MKSNDTSRKQGRCHKQQPEMKTRDSYEYRKQWNAQIADR